jgi:hypothetical protein
VIEAILQDGYVCIQAQFVQHLAGGIPQHCDLTLHPQEGQREAAGQIHQVFVLVAGELDVPLVRIPFQQGAAFIERQPLQSDDLALRHALPRCNDDFERDGRSAQESQDV